MTETITIQFDGGSRGNPGPAGIGVVLSAQDGTPLVTLGRFIGRATNNVAEYRALITGLEKARELGAKKILIRGDSELIVKQMRGEYRVKNEELRDLYEQARQLADRFASVDFRHVRREQNKRADALCNEALDGEAKAPAPKSARKAAAPATGAAVRDEAVECLRAAARAWADGGVAALAPEMVWEQLWSILEENGALRTKPAK